MAEAASGAVSGASATACHGVLVHGCRRIRPGSQALFKQEFEAWAAHRAALLRAAFAFPDPADAELLHLVLWAQGDLPEPGPQSEAFAENSAEDPDTLEAYGSGKVGPAAGAAAAGPAPAVRLNANAPLAGFMRAEHPLEKAGCQPMIGVFKRAIKPGRLEELAKTFQKVCDIWHAKVPGILAATVSAPTDPAEENLVHDVRVFADKASYAAHVDKSDEELTKAMEVWFENYDTSFPHRGALYAEDTSDPSMRTSSIKDKPIKAAFNQFHYGQGGMVGEVPMLK